LWIPELVTCDVGRGSGVGVARLAHDKTGLLLLEQLATMVTIEKQGANKKQSKNV